jgi:hypothetical protein
MTLVALACRAVLDGALLAALLAWSLDHGEFISPWG